MNNSYPNNWYITSLESLTLMITDGSHFSPEHQTEGYPLATVKNMKEDHIDIDSCYKISKEDYDRLVRENDKAEKYDVLFSKDGTVGQSLVFNQYDEVVLLSSIAIIRPDIKILNPYYLKYSLTSDEILNKIIGQKTGTAIRRVILRDIKRIKIPVPPHIEQRGIAEVLGTVDEALRLTDQVIERTEALKRGLMQRLLTQGIGHTEFKDTPLGRIPKTWKIVNVKNIALNFISGGTPSTERKDYWDGDIPWTKSAVLNDIELFKGERRITKEGLKNSASNVVPKDNILFSTRVSIGNFTINRIDIAINQDLTGIVLDKSKISEEFLYWIFSNMKNKFDSIMQGTTIKGILREDLGRFKIPLPPKEEQNIICDILKEVNNKYKNEYNNKNYYLSLKKGLMQILLSGKVRVELREDGLHRVGDSRKANN